mgnify:FL=1
MTQQAKHRLHSWNHPLRKLYMNPSKACTRWASTPRRAPGRCTSGQAPQDLYEDGGQCQTNGAATIGVVPAKLKNQPDRQ